MPSQRSWRLAAALLLAAALAASAFRRVAAELPASPGDRVDPLDVTIERYAPLRGRLPARVGYLFDLGLPRQVQDRPQLAGQRVERLFQAQHALAPTLLVAVLGQPRNGQLEPSEADRRQALSRLDLLLVEGAGPSPIWQEAAQAGFAPVEAVGGVALFRRRGAP